MQQPLMTSQSYQLPDLSGDVSLEPMLNPDPAEMNSWPMGGDTDL